MLHSTLLFPLLTAAVSAALTDSSLETHVAALKLSANFNPIKESYWTGLPHHRRTPFAVSPDGKSAYLAYLDASETNVHVQQLDPSTFAAVGTATTVSGAKEAGGLVAHNDGFALLTNEPLASGTSNAPADNTPVPVLYRYTGGEQSWKTYLGGPGVHEDFGLVATPDINGDLAFSEATGMYGAYFVVTAYSGSAAGHFGDSIQYVTENGTLETIQGASSSWGCSHNTGIAFEAADSVPFASICAEDQGAIWLNTETQSMNGVKISNENVTNGASNEAMGGMSGSYSGLARYIDSDGYIFTWVSRGAKDLTTNDWLGAGFTHSINRTNNRNVAIAQFSDKNTLVGEEATSELVADGDSQVNWITTGTSDCSNAHVAAFDGSNALVTWEEIADPTCEFIAMGCKGAFTGAYYQLVNNGEKVGEPIKSMDVFVAGDMVTMSDGRICWPYVDMEWSLDGPAQGSSVTEMSFACMSLDGSSGNSSTPVSSSTPVASSAPVSSAAPVSTSAASVGEVGSTASPIVDTPSSSATEAVSSTPATSTQGSASEPTFVLESSAPVDSAIASSSAALPTSPGEQPTADTTLPSFDSTTPVADLSTSTSCTTSSTSLPVGGGVASESTLPTETPLPSPGSSKVPCAGSPATVTVTNKEVVTVTVSLGELSPSSSAPSVGEAGTSASAISSFGGPRPSGAPFPSGLDGTDTPPYPTGLPSGGFGSGRPRPSGRPSGGFGRPRPSGGFGGPRPSGGFGGPRPSGGFGGDRTTKVRPTPTGY